MLLTGIIPPIATPQIAGDRVDHPGLRRLIRYQLKAGVHGLFANGTMGGFAFLTDDQQVRAISTTMREVDGKVPVIAGMGETSSARAVRLAKRIAKERPDYLAVLPPFYYLTTPQHLVEYYSEIAEAVDIPLILYDNPMYTQNPILAETVAGVLERVPHLAGVKVSNKDFLILREILALTRGRDNFSVLLGNEFLIVVGLQMGCHAITAGLHTICPQLAVRLYDAFQAGDIEQARKWQQELSDTWQLFRYGSIWGGFDEAFRYLGICQGATGRPYVAQLSEQDRAAVKAILDRHVKPFL